MEAALKKVWKHLQQNVIGEDHSSQEILLPIPPNSDLDIKEIVIAVLRS